MYFLAMAVPNLKSKKVFSNYVIIYFFFKHGCYKHKDGLAGRKEGRNTERNLTKILKCEVSPIRRL